MNYSFDDFLNETPQLIPGFETSMNDYDENIIQGGKFLRRSKEVYKETDTSILFRTGMDHDGYIVLLDKRNNYVNYFVKFEYVKLDGVKRLTQFGLWRSITPSTEEVVGITTKVFFDIFLKKFKVIASDQEQSKDGQQFWIKHMSLAVSKGHKVGLLKVGTNTIEYYDPKKFKNVIDWISTLESSWGITPKFKRYRFIIEL